MNDDDVRAGIKLLVEMDSISPFDNWARAARWWRDNITVVTPLYELKRIVTTALPLSGRGKRNER
jgi:hypothetical protein